LSRPLRRRAERIARPARVRMRSRNPCVFARRRLFGWNVRLLTENSRYTGPCRRDHGAGPRAVACVPVSAHTGFRTRGTGPRAGGRPVNATRRPATGQTGPGHAASPAA
jgi:hypothetical protein